MAADKAKFKPGDQVWFSPAEAPATPPDPPYPWKCQVEGVKEGNVYSVCTTNFRHAFDAQEAELSPVEVRKPVAPVAAKVTVAPEDKTHEHEAHAPVRATRTKHT